MRRVSLWLNSLHELRPEIGQHYIAGVVAGIDQMGRAMIARRGRAMPSTAIFFRKATSFCRRSPTCPIESNLGRNPAMMR
jgi:hypothetical protein